jgi:hypothetical protein
MHPSLFEKDESGTGNSKKIKREIVKAYPTIQWPPEYMSTSSGTKKKTEEKKKPNSSP